MLKALLYAYVLGGFTFIPLVVAVVIFITFYTSVPVGDAGVSKKPKQRLDAKCVASDIEEEADPPALEMNDMPRTRKGWLTVRRTFEESGSDGSYVTLVRSFLDSRSKDSKKSRPKDMWYVVLKGKVLYLYEDEEMTECEAAVELSSHRVIIYPDALPDGELFAKRNAICLKPNFVEWENMPTFAGHKKCEKVEDKEKLESSSSRITSDALDSEKVKDATGEEALDPTTRWFIFVRSNIDMEDWYFSLIHASEHPAQTPTLAPLSAIFEPADMDHLVSTLDEQPDVIPMRWLNALLGRIFFSHYRTHNLEAFIIGRLMKKLSKVKRPAFLTEIVVTHVSVGKKTPMLSKPMLKELTKEGDASIEVHLQYKGEVRITLEATATINLGARFKSYTVKLILAAVLKELEGNLLIKIKRPPSNRIWYAFTQTPRMVLEVEPIVSDRQITWGMILGTIETKIKEIIQESVVMPNMDDISFFESSGYERRGGIWSDACRKTYVSTTISSISDVQSVASAPPPDIAFSVSGETSIPSLIAKPFEEASTDPENALSTSTATVESDKNSLSSNPRRRTWFASVRNEDFSSPNVFGHTDLDIDSEGIRGRIIDTDRSSISTSRSHSTPKPDSSAKVPEYVTKKLDSDALKSDVSLSSQSSRRSSSQSVVKLEQDEVAIVDRDHHVAKSTPTTRQNSDVAQIARSPSPPSFFATLKSKAADKQAIKDTAKEAMRKWGVNWAGFKKDSDKISQPGDDSSSRGGSPPRSGLLSEAAHKARASYAEVRAAVAERKERERHYADMDDELTSPLPSASGTRIVSNPKNTLPNGSVYSDTPINPSIVTSAARLTTPKPASKKSAPSNSHISTELDAQDLPDSDAPIKSPPIHVQPVAKTMSIPGIHVSHRGEVQSMGYVAPQAVASPEPVAKNPAIQTVYRLWKSPTGQVNDGETRSLSTDDSITTEDDMPLANATLALPAKPTPPPLPPRIIFASRTAAAELSGPSASQTLKSLVQKDETRGTPVLEPLPASSSPSTSELASLQFNEAGEASTYSLSVEPELNSVTETSLDLEPLTVDQVPTKTPPTLPPRRLQNST